MYIDQLEKFGLKLFLSDIFSSQHNVSPPRVLSLNNEDFSFSQIDDLIEKSLQKPEELSFMGFQTGKGQKLKIDPTHMEKAFKLLEETDPFQNQNEFADFQKQTLEKTQPFLNEIHQNSLNFPNFHTAKGNLIIIDEKQVKEAEKRFFSEKEENSFGVCEEPFMKGFQTGKGNLIKIDEKKLKAAEKLYFTEKEESSFVVCEDSFVNGFQTAKGNLIKIDENKVKSAEILLFSQKNQKKKNSETTSFANFQTAKGNLIKIDEKNLKEAEKMMINDKTEEIPFKIQEKKPKKQMLLLPNKINGSYVLDFTNKKSKKKLLYHENNQDLSNKAQQQKKKLAKSTEKMKIFKPTSKRIYSMRKSLKFTKFMENAITCQKRTFEDFTNEQNPSEIEKTIKNTKKSSLEKNSIEKEVKSPNSVFSLTAKTVISCFTPTKKLILLKELTIVNGKNTNSAFEINETAAGNHNFICDCVTYSQTSNEKCLCNGKLIINSESFRKFLQEKFPKITISEVF